MTSADEKQMKDAFHLAIRAMAARTGDSPYYVSRVAEMLIREIQASELRIGNSPSAGESLK
jgi:hypothetical protein